MEKKTELVTEIPVSTVVKKPKDKYKIVVDKNGSGDFITIQEALNAVNAEPSERITIFIKNGIYYGKLIIPASFPKISLIGESRENTIITFDDYAGNIKTAKRGTFHSYTILIESDDFIAQNLTIQNTAGNVGQAVSLNLNADRSIINNCALLGNQDTLFTSSGRAKNYFKNCYIEGTTDFIFGDATALFENCTIHSKKNSYITAASTSEKATIGYVFKNCKLTADANTTQVYLGRPWSNYAKTIFINCEMGKHIRPEGWHNWSKPEAEKTTFYGEYKCSGEGFQPKKRVSWSHQLKRAEAKNYTMETILGLDFSKTINELYSK